MRTYDWVIVGAGLTGAVLAERIASQLNQSVLIIDKRSHIGGNCYDYAGEYDILVHKYGPHIFHTNSEKIWRYLSKFTQWRPYFHRSLGHIDGNYIPVPFNLNSLNQIFPASIANKMEHRLIERYGYGKSVNILDLIHDDDPEVSVLSSYLYDKIYKNYTYKKWGMMPDELDRNVSARVPILINRDNRYFQDRYQAMPTHGYTKLFKKILDNKLISVSTGTDYHDLTKKLFNTKTIFTGKIDEYFQYFAGELPYRSVSIVLRPESKHYRQEVGSINYPNEFDFIRITDLWHLTGGSEEGTVLLEEYPEAHQIGVNEASYPIPSPASADLLKPYRAEAAKLVGKTWFAGRLGDYAYYNMDQAVGRALSLFEKQIVAAARS